MELASATPLDGHDYSNFRTAVGKLFFMAPWRPDMQFAIQQLSTQVLNPTTESKRAVKQLIRYLKGTQHTCLRFEPREMVQTGLLELVGRSDSDRASDSATRQCVTGYHCDVQNVTMCNRSLKQTTISLSSCEAEFYAASACAGELLGLAEPFKERHYKVSVRLEMDSDSARHILQCRDQVDSNTSRYDDWQYNNGYERHVYPWFKWTRRTTPPIFSRNNLTDCVQEYFRRNWDYAFWIWLVVRTWVLLMAVRTGKTDDHNWQLLTSVCSWAGV